ncbi:beta-ketoacyl-[acyl-carrier-protein] synthase family protein [Chitinibacter fontanus]|uniref:Beta-ketoacyl-[acyl-carrier-protein] synthase family protein n=1 Tax=Chitinibacter fontanus TaxID=1737446 RepID=A0A7D5VAH8_9NEIS|nr:beta-ketoacyl-[acyl-carrier-protein] synthase family protein [Chitinibacter fontanus]QLI82297.1 beta-ketoacyl-[acyl-carrier-protein] synthase family protein [Chitinibacter fontanus]
MSAYLNHLGLISPLGIGLDGNITALLSGQRGLTPADAALIERPTWVGQAKGELPQLPPALAHYHSRNNQQLYAAALQIDAPIQAALAQYGAARVAIVLGTSTSGIAESESALAQLEQGLPTQPNYSYQRHEMGDPARFLAELYQIKGPAYTISTACSSSARALITARRLLKMNLVDVVLCGGVDSLCRLTLNGFAALESVSAAPCNPFRAARDGINIGEAAALFIMSHNIGPVRLAGYGASCDAHHISAPHPQGRGASAAMQAALVDAQLSPAQISYLNLHGTATPLNDAMESQAVVDTFGAYLPPSSSSKALTGHTLGAAGALEAAFCYLLLQKQFNPMQHLPPQIGDGDFDTSLPALHWPQAGQSYPLKTAMSNSFAFGGNNVSLIFQGVEP